MIMDYFQVYGIMKILLQVDYEIWMVMIMICNFAAYK